MTEPDAIVHIIDDDRQVRESVANLGRSVGLDVWTFTSPDEYLKAGRPAVPSCIILDLRFPGFAPSGLDFQRTLDPRTSPPIIFVTGHGDVEIAVQAMQLGALEFLIKPVREQKLLDAIRRGIARDRQRLDEAKQMSLLRHRFESLSMREREVMNLVAEGHLNKEIAARIGLSEFTVKGHRGRIMLKMGARSLADLVRMSDRLHERDGAAAPRTDRKPDDDPQSTTAPALRKAANPQRF
jgi:FixJ family two-component response regulator